MHRRDFFGLIGKAAAVAGAVAVAGKLPPAEPRTRVEVLTRRFKATPDDFAQIQQRLIDNATAYKADADRLTMWTDYSYGQRTDTYGIEVVFDANIPIRSSDTLGADWTKGAIARWQS